LLFKYDSIFCYDLHNVSNHLGGMAQLMGPFRGHEAMPCFPDGSLPCWGCLRCCLSCSMLRQHSSSVEFVHCLAVVLIS